MAKKLLLSEYEQPAYWTKTTDLTFEVVDTHTVVTSRLMIQKNINSEKKELLLNGDGQEILSFKLDDVALEPKAFQKDNNLQLLLHKNEHIIEIVTKIFPKDNKSFEGLYSSNNKYFTQCEAEGFRKITYYQDRPDVLSKFTTTIIASNYPVMLSNGNLIKHETLANGRTKVVWQDPFPKPAYLFALVLGDFDKITDSFTTRSQRKVLLEVYVDKGMTSRASHAMKSVIESMKWDEDRYDLEYDLDRYMIVAANDFNFGAMENKGLNIFNAKYVLADKESATDVDFYNIQAVVGHEYFHNWTGNRVTCRDWFQLSLKEGLTVYRDQEFSSDLNSRGVKRIDDVIRLRASQFSEDAGGNAHPVRPSEAFNISNFYTATIYEKGAELIRMIETLIGRDAFKKGIKKYFELYDGQAVTTEDFCHAMSLASGRDLQFFQKWYTQKGTPKLEVKRSVSGACLQLEFKQLTSPLLLPILSGFIDSNGNEITNIKVKQATCKYQLRGTSILFELEKDTETVILDLPASTRVSLLRDFSAPIILKYEGIENEVYDLAAFDTNDFAKWEAIQTLVTKDILKNTHSKEYSFDEKLVQIIKKILTDKIQDAAYTAKLLRIPTLETLLLEFESSFPIEELDQTLKAFTKNLFRHLENELLHVYNSFAIEDSSAARSLKNTVLSILTVDKKYLSLAKKQFDTASNMTDVMMALNALKGFVSEELQSSLKTFYAKWHKDSLVYTKYLQTVFSKQATNFKQDFENLFNDPAFEVWNPNHNYASFDIFAHNLPAFHASHGEGYQIIAKRVLELDAKNPYVAARLANAFNDYKKLDSTRKPLMKIELEKMLQAKLSSNTYEIIYNALN